MPASALAFALGAAGFHALWNLLLARAPDIESATAVALIVAELVFLPVSIVVWRADAGVWPWLVGSGLFEIVYFGAGARVKGAAALRAAVGPATVVAGVATFTAYALVLAALQRASAASVAAVRETSVVVATALAAVVLKERVGSVRIAGAV